MSTSNLLTVGMFRRVVLICIYMLINKKHVIKDIYFNSFWLGSIIYILFIGNEVLANRSSLTLEIMMVPAFANLNIKLKGNCIFYLGILFLISLLIYLYTIINGSVIPYCTYL